MEQGLEITKYRGHKGRRFGRFLAMVLICCLLQVPLAASAYEDTSSQWKQHQLGLDFKYRSIAVSDQNTHIIVGDRDGAGALYYTKGINQFIVAELPTQESLFGAAWGKGYFVVVGLGGSILYSGDGETWEIALQEEDTWFTDVVYGDQGFVAVGSSAGLLGQNDERYLYYSPNGYDWRCVFVHIGAFSWDRIEYDNGTYFAFSAETEFAYSQDGVQWTVVDLPEELGYTQLFWNGSEYIAYGNEYTLHENWTWTREPQIHTTTDFKTWTPVAFQGLGDVFLADLQWYNGSYYLAVSTEQGYELRWSEDLEVWDPLSSQLYEPLNDSLLVGNALVYVGDGGTMVAVDEEAVYRYLTKSFHASSLITVGSHTILVDSSGVFYTTEDGSKWEIFDTFVEGSVVGLVWTGSQYLMAVYDDEASSATYDQIKLYSSVTGVDWRLESVVADSGILDIHHVNGRYFLSGAKGLLYWSDNGRDWRVSPMPFEGSFFDVVWFKGSYYAAGDYAGLAMSKDGESWQRVELGMESYLVTFATSGSTLLVAGGNGSRAITENGVDWIEYESDTLPHLEKALWDGSDYVLFSRGETYYKTKDGAELKAYYSDVNTEVWLADWNGLRYLVAGMDGVVTSFIPTDLIKVVVKDQPVLFQVAPQVIQDRTMVPARAVFEKVGAQVAWDGATRSVHVTSGDQTIAITVDSTTALVNGIARELDAPAVIVDGSTLVPLRFIAEALGMQVQWDANTRTVFIQ